MYFFNLRYDGEVVDEKSLEDATHIIVSSPTEKITDSNSSTRVKMTEKNFWSCVKNKKFFIE
jgi:hypothetical protein